MQYTERRWHNTYKQEDSTGVCAKINQDRGCIVYPFMGSATAALLCVFDGHGEHGDSVSNFAMLEMSSRLAVHPSILVDPAAALRDSFVAINTALTKLGETAVYRYRLKFNCVKLIAVFTVLRK